MHFDHFDLFSFLPFEGDLVMGNVRGELVHPQGRQLIKFVQPMCYQQSQRSIGDSFQNGESAKSHNKGPVRVNSDKRHGPKSSEGTNLRSGVFFFFLSRADEARGKKK